MCQGQGERAKNGGLIMGGGTDYVGGVGRQWSPCYSCNFSQINIAIYIIFGNISHWVSHLN